MSELIRFTKKIIVRTLLLPLRLIPISEKRILLINDLSYNYSDNLKYISEFLIKNYKNELEIVFSGKKEYLSSYIPTKIKMVEYNSLKYFFYGMTAKVLVTNSGGISYMPLRKKQFVINTWHGGGAYKKAGIHMYNDSYLFKKDLLLSANQTSIFLSTNQRFTEVISESMLIPKNVFWEIGMPRNDILMNNDLSLKEDIRKKIGLEKDEKLVLFAPTYRKINDNYFNDSVAISYGIDEKRVCNALHKRFGGKWRFAIRFHPCIVNREEFISDDILDLTDYTDMQELLLIADVMINDFSSSLWDFMLTKKPCFMFAKDLQHYIDTTEVYTPVNEWPFPKSTNNDELEKSIVEFDEKKYLEKCKKHYQSLGGCETGEATRLVCERISNICNN